MLDLNWKLKIAIVSLSSIDTIQEPCSRCIAGFRCPEILPVCNARWNPPVRLDDDFQDLVRIVASALPVRQFFSVELCLVTTGILTPRRRRPRLPVCQRSGSLVRPKPTWMR